VTHTNAQMMGLSELTAKPRKKINAHVGGKIVAQVCIQAV